jgi:hypothetical protein
MDTYKWKWIASSKIDKYNVHTPFTIIFQKTSIDGWLVFPFLSYLQIVGLRSVFFFLYIYIYNYFLTSFYVCLLLKILVNRKYFLIKEKCDLIFMKVFFFVRKLFFKSYENFKNILLFIDILSWIFWLL